MQGRGYRFEPGTLHSPAGRFDAPAVFLAMKSHIRPMRADDTDTVLLGSGTEAPGSQDLEKILSIDDAVAIEVGGTVHAIPP